MPCKGMGHGNARRRKRSSRINIANPRSFAIVGIFKKNKTRGERMSNKKEFKCGLAEASCNCRIRINGVCILCGRRKN